MVRVREFPGWPPCWRHWSVLGQEWLIIHPKCSRGTWGPHTLSQFPWSHWLFPPSQAWRVLSGRSKHHADARCFVEVPPSTMAGLLSPSTVKWKTAAAKCRRSVTLLRRSFSLAGFRKGSCLWQISWNPPGPGCSHLYLAGILPPQHHSLSQVIRFHFVFSGYKE